MPAKTSLLTRRRYARDKDALHERYYSQFVTEQTLRAVQSAFGVERLREALAEDPELGSIPPRQWDAVTLHQIDGTRFIGRLPLNRVLVSAAGDTVTRVTLTGIAKAAARILVEQDTGLHSAQAA
ncbi:MAG: hypothetical protein ABWX92_05965 [Mycetocola sp.]